MLLFQLSRTCPATHTPEPATPQATRLAQMRQPALMAATGDGTDSDGGGEAGVRGAGPGPARWRRPASRPAARAPASTRRFGSRPAGPAPARARGSSRARYPGGRRRRKAAWRGRRDGGRGHGTVAAGPTPAAGRALTTKVRLKAARRAALRRRAAAAPQRAARHSPVTPARHACRWRRRGAGPRGGVARLGRCVGGAGSGVGEP